MLNGLRTNGVSAECEAHTKQHAPEQQHRGRFGWRDGLLDPMDDGGKAGDDVSTEECKNGGYQYCDRENQQYLHLYSLP